MIWTAHLLSKSHGGQNVGWPKHIRSYLLGRVHAERCSCLAQGSHDFRPGALIRHRPGAHILWQRCCMLQHVHLLRRNVEHLKCDPRTGRVYLSESQNVELQSYTFQALGLYALQLPGTGSHRAGQRSSFWHRPGAHNLWHRCCLLQNPLSLQQEEVRMSSSHNGTKGPMTAMGRQEACIAARMSGLTASSEQIIPRAPHAMRNVAVQAHRQQTFCRH